MTDMDKQQMFPIDPLTYITPYTVICTPSLPYTSSTNDTISLAIRAYTLNSTPSPTVPIFCYMYVCMLIAAIPVYLMHYGSVSLENGWSVDGTCKQ